MDVLPFNQMEKCQSLEVLLSACTFELLQTKRHSEGTLILNMFKNDMSTEECL
jgi:hypothetical protein